MIKIMDDRELEKLVKSINSEVTPPEGLREKLLVETMALEYGAEYNLTPFERLIFEKPLWTACAIAISISGSLWAVLGSGYAKLLIGMIG